MILQNGKLTLWTSNGRQPQAPDCCEPKAADLIHIFAVVAAAAVADVAQPVLETCLLLAERLLPANDE